MIHYRQGDLLTTNDEYIIHGVNCRGVMNAGLAKTIREKWPVVYCRYMEMIKRFNKDDVPDDERLSSFQIVEISDPRNRPTHVINFFSQTTYGHNGRFVSYDALDEGLAALAVELRKRKVKSISIPKIGSGLGGGNWKVIEQIIDHRFQDFNVWVWEYEQRRSTSARAVTAREAIIRKEISIIMVESLLVIFVVKQGG